MVELKCSWAPVFTGVTTFYEAVIFAQLPKAFEAEEKRISLSRDSHYIEKAQIRALPFPGDLGTFVVVISRG